MPINVPKNLNLSIRDRNVYLNRRLLIDSNYEVSFSIHESHSKNRIRIDINVPKDNLIFKEGEKGFIDFILSFKNE